VHAYDLAAVRPRGRRALGLQLGQQVELHGLGVVDGAEQAQVGVDLRRPLRAAEDDLDAPLGGAHGRARVERGRRQTGEAEHRL
jgi:hypothetical protein